MAHYNKYGRFCHGTKSISNDMRELIITDIKELGGNTETGAIPRGVATSVGAKFRLDSWTVTRIWKRFVEMKSVSPLKRGRKDGQGRKLTQEDELYVEQLLTLNPTMYRKEVISKVLQYSNTPDLLSVSLTTIGRTIKKRLSGGEWTRKKVKSSNQNRWSDDNMRLTQTYFDFISRQDKFSIKFMDEAGVNLNASKRTYGYAPKGEVAVEISKHVQGPNHTVNLLVGLDGTKFCTVLTGASETYSYINFWHEAMNAYSDTGYAVLRPGDIVVVDNCPFHHSEAERILTDYFEDYNITYMFLPRYSPDLNPVEACFMKMKKLLKQGYYQNLLRDNFVAPAVLDTIAEISLSDIFGFYKGCTGNYMNID